jgi:RHS repeat-associated protein
MSYDVEGRMSHIDSTALTTTADYTYDGEGHRIISTINNITTHYVYDAFGNLAAEYGGSNTDSGTQYLTTDHLGSTRLITGSSPVAVKARIDYTPFGEEVAVSGCGLTGPERSPRCDIPGYLPAVGSSVATNVRLRFTGKERDLRSDDTPYGLDYFGARYFSSAQGRFTSPDPKQFTARHLSYPQKWNKYAYVQNNPLTSIDPDGLDDYKIFIGAPEGGGGGNWKRAELAARANGHTLQVFPGDKATLKNYNRALGDPNSRVIFIGHSTHDAQGTNGVQLFNGISAGTASQTTDQAASATVTGVTVNANTVGLFACDTKTIMGQYTTDNPNTSVVGVDSGKNKETSIEALGASAAAFVAADAVARPAGGQAQPNAPNPVAAANSALQQNKRKEDLDGDKIIRKP